MTVRQTPMTYATLTLLELVVSSAILTLATGRMSHAVASNIWLGLFLEMILPFLTCLYMKWHDLYYFHPRRSLP